MNWCDYCGAETVRLCRKAACVMSRYLDGDGEAPKGLDAAASELGVGLLCNKCGKNAHVGAEVCE